MQKFKFVTSLFVSALLLSSATFAHVDMKDELIAVAPTIYNWTGFYAGLNIGAVQHTLNITDTNATSFNATIQQQTDPRLTGGFQVGYRRQLDLTKASGVYGIEFSANFSDASYSKEYGSPFALYQLNSHNSLEAVCLLELIGGIAADRTLLFLAAGLSWAKITGSTTTVNGIPFFNSFSVNKQVFGTAVGAGLEYAFSDRISVRFKVDVIRPNTYSTSDNTNNNFQISNNIVQGTVGINYNFA